MANILVIDDDKDFRSVLKIMLSRLGHTPTLATRGEEGFALAVSNSYDLVLLDLMMPDMDGYEITRRLRATARTANLPILILTARTQPADREGAMEAGADGYLTKPVDPRELSSKITEMLSLQRPEPAEHPAPTPASATTATVTARPTPPPSQPTLPPGPPPSGRAIVVLGLRGGVGATTVSVNLAGALTRAGRRACIVDLNPSTGHVTLQLRVRPKATWADLPPAIDTGVMAQAITRHDSGIFVFAAPAQPVRYSMPAETFQMALYHLRNFFTDVIVDAAPMLDDPTNIALGQCKHVLAVLNPDVASVQTTIGTLRALTALNIAETQIRVVLNNTLPDPLVTQAAVEKALGRPVDVTLPFERAQASALAQGIPLVLSQPTSPLVTAIAGLAAKLVTSA
jgi:CheY-like chemotaxis protein